MTIKRADWAKKWAREIVKRPAADLVDEIAAALRAERKASEKRGAADELEGILKALLTDPSVLENRDSERFALGVAPAFRKRIGELRNWREIEEGR